MTRELLVVINKAKHEITQVHVSDWKDNTGGPDAEMYAIVAKVDALIENFKITDTGVAVHCSAGIGRTGQFINSLLIYRQLKADPDAEIDPYQIAKEGIETRYGFGVMHPDQYSNLYSFIVYARDQLKTQI